MPLALADLDEVAGLYGDERVMRHLDGGARTREQTRSNLEAAERCWRAEGWGRWAIRDATSGALLGEGGLQHNFDIEGAPVSFSIIISRRVWGEGYGTEAGHVIIDDAWDRYDADALHAVLHPDNTAGAALLRKLAFRRAENQTINGVTQQVWEIPRLR
jgi:RimJ/RimL family protein N-acetyltransferase